MNRPTVSLAMLLPLLGACVQRPMVLDAGADAETGDDLSELGDPGETGGDPTDDPTEGEDQLLELTANKDIDILFVIDNSGSMGEEQAMLAANVSTFIDVLEAPGVDANYRIGITTSDNGNPWCPSETTTPEHGDLVASSCKDRLGDFLFGDEVDVRDLACNEICTLSAAELEILPTITELDPTPKPRPWLERIEGNTNIPTETSMADAFACFGPQGVNGCGFESQLESMSLALRRAAMPGEASYGFMRADAILAVVIMTDEVDCSYNEDYATIFDAEADKLFWSDPMAAFPTSAICWNAGVECYGDPSGYDGCDPVNKDVEGNVGVADADAVLRPMSRYIGFLDSIEAEKQQLNPHQEVIVTLIGGVAADGQPVYADAGANDLEWFQDSFGIGPGCTAPADVAAVPPVRLRDLSESFTPDNMFSICQSDYSPALLAISKSLQSQIKPACYLQCVADTDPQTALVDAQCSVEQQRPGETPKLVPECLRDANGYVLDPNTDGYVMPSADIDVCHAKRVDRAGLSADPLDDMTSQCADQHYNLQFEIVRRPGVTPPGGTEVTAKCELAAEPEATCPGLGG